MKKLFKKILTAVAAGVFFLLPGAQAAEIDWQAGEITATASGADTPEGRNAIFKTVREDMRWAVDAVAVDEAANVGRLAENSMLIRERLLTLLDSLQIKTENRAGGSVTQTFRLPLYGISHSVINCALTSHTGNQPFAVPEGADKFLPAGKDAPKEPGVRQNAGDYSGVILDCRGRKFSPQLLPVIRNDRGDTVYSKDNLSKGDILSRGLAGYAATPEAAAGRVGDRPLFLRGLNVENGVIILRSEDSDLLLTINRYACFLQGGRVAILFGK